MKWEKAKIKGFTLIELLVVIAIIGILAAIVFINVASIRGRAKDAAVKMGIDQLSYLAQVYYDERNGNYGGFCNDDRVETVYDAIPGADCDKNPKKCKVCHHDSDEWTVCVQLNVPEDKSKAWCLDSTGNKKQIDQADCEADITFCP